MWTPNPQTLPRPRRRWARCRRCAGSENRPYVYRSNTSSRLLQRAGGSAQTSCGLLNPNRSHGNSEAEHGSRLPFRFHPHATTVSLDDLFGNRQPNAASRILVASVKAREKARGAGIRGGAQRYARRAEARVGTLRRAWPTVAGTGRGVLRRVSDVRPDDLHTRPAARAWFEQRRRSSPVSDERDCRNHRGWVCRERVGRQGARHRECSPRRRRDGRSTLCDDNACPR